MFVWPGAGRRPCLPASGGGPSALTEPGLHWAPPQALTALHVQACLAVSTAGPCGASRPATRRSLCVRGWPAPGPVRCPPSKVMAATDTVLCQGQASRRSRLQNRTRASSARISRAPRLIWGCCPRAPCLHARTALPPTGRKSLSERAAEQDASRLLTGPGGKGVHYGFLRAPGFSLRLHIVFVIRKNNT